MEVVRFDYMVIMTYGGKFNGKGAYLTGVQMIPSNINVMYGFDLNAKMKVQSIANHGTKSNPNAGVVLVLNYRVSNMLNSSEINDTVLLTGNGLIQNY